MYHRMVQVAFASLQKLYRLQSGSGVGENGDVALTPFFHDEVLHQCERVTVCTCAFAASTIACLAIVDQPTEAGSAPVSGQPGGVEQPQGVEAAAPPGLNGGSTDGVAGATAPAGEQEPWSSDTDEDSGIACVDVAPSASVEDGLIFN